MPGWVFDVLTKKYSDIICICFSKYFSAQFRKSSLDLFIWNFLSLIIQICRWPTIQTWRELEPFYLDERGEPFGEDEHRKAVWQHKLLHIFPNGLQAPFVWQINSFHLSFLVLLVGPEQTLELAIYLHQVTKCPGSQGEHRHVWTEQVPIYSSEKLQVQVQREVISTYPNNGGEP